MPRNLTRAAVALALASALGTTASAHAIPPLGEEGAGVDGCLVTFTPDGVVTGGPFVVPGATEITFTCVVYSVAGTSQTVSQTLPGGVGAAAGRYSLNSSDDRVCGRITWTALNGRSYGHSGHCLAWADPNQAGG